MVFGLFLAIFSLKTAFPALRASAKARPPILHS